tara:strand:- start:5561 stop:6865 length:1305 start_codon:yes stop_codon:yes gene_type:complete
MLNILPVVGLGTNRISTDYSSGRGGWGHLSRTRIIAFLVFFSFFPYVGFFRGIDVQPFFVLPVAAAVLLVKNRRWPAFLNVIIISYIPIMAYLAVSIIFGGEGYFGFVLSYVLCFFVIVLFCILHASVKIDMPRIAGLVAIIYVLVAFIQMYLDPYFLAGMKSRSVDMVGLLIDSGRGVSSLASEPSKFSKVLLYCNIFFYMGSVLFGNGETDSKIYRLRLIFISVSLLFLNVWLSRSLHYCTIHFMLVLFIVFGLSRLASIFAFAAFAFLLAFMVENREHLDAFGRLGELLESFLVDPRSIAEQGAFRRLANPLLSVIVFFDNPLGVGSALQEGRMYYLRIGEFEYPFFFVSRILGGIVEFLIKFGFFSFLFIFSFVYVFFKTAIAEWKKTHALVAVPFVLISAFFDGSVVDPYAWSSIFYIYFRMNDGVKYG